MADLNENKNNLANSGVAFKYGSQAGYDGLAAKEQGTFYVTSDTHKLYLGDNLLSQAVLTYNTLDEILSAESEVIKNDGQIYYALDKNVLCVYNKDGGGWVQLNPDTYIDAVSYAASTNSTKGVDLKLSIQQGKRTDSYAKFDKTVNIYGEDNVSVSADKDGNIVVTGEKLSVHDLDEETEGSGAYIQLGNELVHFIPKEISSVNEQGESIKTKTKLKIDVNSNNEIEIENTGVVTGGTLSVVKRTPTDESPNNTGFQIKAGAYVDGSTVEFKNNATAVVDPIIELNDESQYKFGQAYAYKDENDELKTKSEAGVVKLPVYTTAEVDQKLQEKLNAINAMTYKGTFGLEADDANDPTQKHNLPTTGVKVGDVWIAAKPVKLDVNKQITTDATGEDYLAGTLFIATGTETDGVITSGLNWNAVATSDTDTKYNLRLDSTHNKVLFNQNVSGSITTLQNVEFAGDNHISWTTTGGTNDIPDIKLTAQHADPDADNATDSGEVTATGNIDTATETSINFIAGASIDSKGHVADVNVRQLVLADIIAKTDGTNTQFAITDANNGAGAKIAYSYKNTKDSARIERSFEIHSDTLTINPAKAAEADTRDTVINMNLMWGTFE